MGIDANVSLKPLVSTEPELPRVYVDTTLYAPTGDTIHVASGGNLQTAINAAALGDVITLEAGATFTGPFTLPDKGAGTDYIVIRTDTTDQNFVAEGTRVAPADASLMPHLISASANVFNTANGAHHYRFIGVEVSPTSGYYLNCCMDFTTSLANAHHIIVDRCYVHGDATEGTRRGVALNCAYGAVIDSYVSNCKEVGADTQAVIAWTGGGPLKVVNNYLEAAAENFHSGGVDPSDESLIPADIVFTRNHCFKPLAWKTEAWNVKNIFELKNALRVLVEGNLFENNWVQGQDGSAILFTPRNQNNTAPWSRIEDVTFRYNVVTNTVNVFNVAAWDNEHPSHQTKRIKIHDNLCTSVSGTFALVLTGGTGVEVGGIENLVMEHNTCNQDFNITSMDGLARMPDMQHQGFVFRYNIAPHNLYGMTGESMHCGNQTLVTFCLNPIVTENVFSGIDNVEVVPSDYPSGNYFPATFADVDFVDLGNGDYRLDASSPYKGIAPGGRDLGMDKTALDAAMGDLAQTYW